MARTDRKYADCASCRLHKLCWYHMTVEEEEQECNPVEEEPKSCEGMKKSAHLGGKKKRAALLPAWKRCSASLAAAAIGLWTPGADALSFRKMFMLDKATKQEMKPSPTPEGNSKPSSDPEGKNDSRCKEEGQTCVCIARSEFKWSQEYGIKNVTGEINHSSVVIFKETAEGQPRAWIYEASFGGTGDIRGGQISTKSDPEKKLEYGLQWVGSHHRVTGKGAKFEFCTAIKAEIVVEPISRLLMLKQGRKTKILRDELTLKDQHAMHPALQQFGSGYDPINKNCNHFATIFFRILTDKDLGTHLFNSQQNAQNLGSDSLREFFASFSMCKQCKPNEKCAFEFDVDNCSWFDQVENEKAVPGKQDEKRAPGLGPPGISNASTASGFTEASGSSDTS